MAIFILAGIQECITGKSLSEALLFAEHGENMLCTEIVSDFRKFFYTTCYPHGLQKEELLTKISLLEIVFETANHYLYISWLTNQGHEGRKRHLQQPHFSKGLTKLAILPDYKCAGLICLALPARQVCGLILVIKFFLSLSKLA